MRILPDYTFDDAPKPAIVVVPRSGPIAKDDGMDKEHDNTE